MCEADFQPSCAQYCHLNVATLDGPGILEVTLCFHVRRANQVHDQWVWVAGDWLPCVQWLLVRQEHLAAQHPLHAVLRHCRPMIVPHCWAKPHLGPHLISLAPYPTLQSQHSLVDLTSPLLQAWTLRLAILRCAPLQMQVYLLDYAFPC